MLFKVKSFVLISVLLLSVQCNSISNKQESGSKSGYIGDDCSSIKDDITHLSTVLVDAEATMNQIMDKATKDKLKTPKECEKFNTQNDLNLYHACLRYTNILAAKKAREKSLAEYNCSRNNVELSTVFAAYCDVPCTSGDVECSIAEFPISPISYLTFICGTEESVKEATSSYCKAIEIDQDKCPTVEIKHKKGDEIIVIKKELAGSPTETEQYKLSTTVEASASLEANVGVSLSTKVQEGQSNDNILEIEASNKTLPIYLNENIYGERKIYSPGTTVECTLSFQYSEFKSASLFAGLGGGFELFGNGAKIKVGVETNAKVDHAVKSEVTLGGKIPAGGLQREIVINQCRQFVKQWASLKINESYRTIVSLINAARNKIIQTQFQETSIDVKHHQIFCSTNEDNGNPFKKGTKVLKINTVFLAANNGDLSIRVNLDGSINKNWESRTPFVKNIFTQVGSQNNASENNLCNNPDDLSQCKHYNNVGTIIDKISKGETLSKDDIIHLLDDVHYNGSNKFLDCRLIGFD